MCLGSHKKSQNHEGTLLPPLLATAPIFSCEWPASSVQLKRVSTSCILAISIPDALCLISQIISILCKAQDRPNLWSGAARALSSALACLALTTRSTSIAAIITTTRQTYNPALQPRPGSPERPWHGNINIRIYRKNIESSRISTQLKVHSLDG